MAKYTQVTFRIDEESGILNAILSSSDTDQEIDLNWLLNQVKINDYQEYRVQTSDLQDVLKRVQKHEYGTIPIGAKPEFTNVKLEYDTNRRTLDALLIPSSTKITLDSQILHKMIRDSGYAEFILAEDAINNLLKKFLNNEQGRFLIGRKPTFLQLSFQVDDETGGLIARFTETEEKINYARETVTELLKQPEFENFVVDGDNIKKILDQIDNGVPAEFLVANKPTFTQVEIDYDPNTRKVEAILTPSEIKHEINVSTLQDELREKGFDTFGIKLSALSDIATKAIQHKHGTYILGERPVYTEITLDFDPDTGVLNANLNPTDDEVHHSLVSLQELIRDNQFDDFHFEDRILEKLVTYATKKEYGTIAIAKKKDAEVIIELINEDMEAQLTTTRAYGGEPLDKTTLEAKILATGIKLEYCDQKMLQQALQQEEVSKLIFAKGVEPKDGEDAKFEPLVEETIQREHKEDKTGRVNMKEVLDFTFVTEGTPLMRRTPASKGVNGYNVRGEVVPAINGDDTPFDPDLNGATISPEDENLLVAETKGHPLIKADGVAVDKTLVVENVGMATGNIFFDGSVLVRGEVMAGMKISVTGDIIVNGVVTNSVLKAGNDISIGAGVLGADHPEDDETFFSCSLIAGGNITANYVNLTDIRAGRNINVKEYLSHCHIEAHDQVLAGQGGGKGRIFGGECFAKNQVIVNTLGSEGGVRTKIIVGTKKNYNKDLEKVRKAQAEKLHEIDRLKALEKKLATLIKQNPQNIELIRKFKIADEAVKKLNASLTHISEVISKIQKMKKTTQAASIVIVKNTYPIVDIMVNGAEFIIRQNSKGGTFTKEGDDIRWST